MNYLIYFLILFIVTFSVYFFIFENMLKKEKYTKITELVLLTKVFNLDKKKMNYHSCLRGVALINSLIISSTIIAINLFKISIIFCLIIAFFVMLILIYSCYMLYGKYLQKKYGKSIDKQK